MVLFSASAMEMIFSGAVTGVAMLGRLPMAGACRDALYIAMKSGSWHPVQSMPMWWLGGSGGNVFISPAPAGT